jgi:trans-aconitate 2-methyltransferase
MAASEPKEQIAASGWNPDQYLKFGDQRLRPALELLERVPLEAPVLVYDLGCGTGHITRIMAARWPQAKVYGLDHSRQMLDTAAGQGTVQWIEADIRVWVPDEAPDVLFANAALQWVDGHQALFPRLCALLKPGGCLAVQMPLSWGASSHVLMRQVLANGGPQGAPLGTVELQQTVGRDWVKPAAFYYDLLAPECRVLDIWETEYLQVLEGEDPVFEWVKGTGLRPVLNGLAAAEKAVFMDEYKRRLRRAYPRRADGRTLYPFRRLFIVATV